jgi:hypothetical protein
MAVRLVPLLVATVVSWGCATTRVDPALFSAERFAIASVHARRSIDFESVRVAPMLNDNELGAEVVEMELGETEVRLGEMFGAEVLPVGKALEQKVYDKLPEAWPPEDWSQVNDMIAVDVDAPGAAPVLGELAQVLKVDAVIVLRHEFALARDRFEVAEGATAFDRCTILVVDRNGRKLWDDVVIARVPVQTMMSGQFAVGLQYATWADEARQVSRRTARQALDIFAKRYAELKRRGAPVEQPAS